MRQDKVEIKNENVDMHVSARYFFEKEQFVNVSTFDNSAGFSVDAEDQLFHFKFRGRDYGELLRKVNRVKS